MKLQIVIPVLNLWQQYTLPCIASIKTSFEHRILLIDNGSTDETNVEARALVGPSFTYHRNGSNLGVSRAWNDGIQDGFEHGYDLALILNNDIILHPRCVDYLVLRMTAAEEKIGMVTAVDVSKDLASPGCMSDLAVDLKETLIALEEPNFSAFLISRACWESVGPFDEAYFPAYFEDNDYHFRVKLKGLRAVAHPPALFYHFGSATQYQSKDAPVVPSQYYMQNRAYYFRKWGGLPGHETFSEAFGRKESNKGDAPWQPPSRLNPGTPGPSRPSGSS